MRQQQQAAEQRAVDAQAMANTAKAAKDLSQARIGTGSALDAAIEQGAM